MGGQSGGDSPILSLGLIRVVYNGVDQDDPVKIPVTSTTLSYSQRRIPAKAVEHVEEPSIVHDVEQAHDFPDPAADHG
jgi:hypothetical protein